MSESILEEAQRLIHGDRNVSYGHPRDNFAAIAALWNGYLEAMGPRTRFSSQDVANLMILMKVGRVVNDNYHRDSYTDICGYAGTAERLQEPLPGLVVPAEPSYHYVLHTEPREPRVFDRVVDADGSFMLRDCYGFTWSKRGNRWGWSGEDDSEWHHVPLKELRTKDRFDAPYTEVM